MKFRRRLRQMFLALCILVVLAVLGGWAYLQHPKFGAMPEGEHLAAISRSPNHDGVEFRNLEPSPVMTASKKKGRLETFWDVFFVKRERLRPDSPLPVAKTDLKALPTDRDTVVWLGHSSYYVQFGGKRFLIDPVFSEAAAPVSFANKAFAGTSLYSAEDMPAIDHLLITHDHWDHLDHPGIVALRPKVAQVVTGLGVGAHLERWGYAKTTIREVDWWDAVKLADDLTLHAIPARHFSGRLFNRNKTLWLGFVLETPTRRILFSGDTGYGKHFAEIGSRLGPFDLAVLDIGQYDPDWQHVHMFPEEATQAAVDLRAAALLPGHIGRFSISRHAWDDPFKRIVAASEGKPYRLLTPTIGAPLDLADANQRFERWWETVK